MGSTVFKLYVPFKSHVKLLCFTSLIVTRGHHCFFRTATSFASRAGGNLSVMYTCICNTDELADKVSQLDKLMPTIFPLGAISPQIISVFVLDANSSNRGTHNSTRIRGAMRNLSFSLYKSLVAQEQGHCV